MGEIVHVCLVGALGKMGLMLQELMEQDDDTSLIIRVDSLFSTAYNDYKDIMELDEPELVDVVVDFSNPESTEKVALWCSRNGKPLVTGTTGLTDEQIQHLKAFAHNVPILRDSNMSLGVNLIDTLLPQMVRILEGFEIEMVEIHNSNKKDSPSGTAIRFAETLVKAKGGEIIYGRAKGKSDNRPINDVVVHAIRGGTVPGEHTIYFLGPDEIIEIKHRALSRKIFALGAIKAAKWIIGQKPGLYSMNDVLGL